MAFRATCPYCGATYPDIQESHRGEKAKCGRCSQWFKALPPDPAASAAAEKARQLHFRFIRVGAVIIDPTLLVSVPVDALQRLNAVPIGRAGNEMVVAMADPGDVYKVDELRRHLPALRPVMGLAYEIDQALRELTEDKPEAEPEDTGLASLGGNRLAAAALAEMEEEYDPTIGEEIASGSRPRAQTEGWPARVALDKAFAAALAVGATEIRILPMEGKPVLQARVDTGLQPLPSPTGVEYEDLLRCIKLDAGCNAALSGSEQTGSIPYSSGERDYEFYARILPGRGSDVVQLRILDAAAMKQRRALERRHLIDESLSRLAGTDWPPPSLGIDRQRAKNIVVMNIEQQLAAVRLTVAVLGQAVDQNVADLVLEPHKGLLRVLVRNEEGHFQPMMVIPPAGQTPLLHRLHLMANLDLTDTIHSQEGLFHLVRGGIPQEVRIMTLPTETGLYMLVHFHRSR